MTVINLYEILGVSMDCTKSELKNAYNMLAKKHHPDKNGGNDNMFELITEAYNILKNEKSRQLYDQTIIDDDNDNIHLKLKSEYEKHARSISAETTNVDYDALRKQFDDQCKELNKKHNYDSSMIDKISKQTTDKMMESYLLAREQEDIETTHEKLFEKFDVEKFNAIFDKVNQSNNQLVESQNIQPYEMSIGCPLGNYGSLYDEVGTIFEKECKPTKITKNMVENIEGAKYTKGHIDRSSCDEQFRKMMSERNSLDIMFKNTVKYQDTDDTITKLMAEREKLDMELYEIQKKLNQ